MEGQQRVLSLLSAKKDAYDEYGRVINRYMLKNSTHTNKLFDKVSSSLSFDEMLLSSDIMLNYNELTAVLNRLIDLGSINTINVNDHIEYVRKG